MSRRRDRIEKLLRLAESDNLHEAALAREEAARLVRDQSEPVAALRNSAAYPHQLPGAIRIPRSLGANR